MTEAEIMNILGVSKDVLDEIDKGIVPLLCELNSKGYKTCGSCEGHTNKENGKWNIALGFAHWYKFETIPLISTYKFNKERNMLFMNWDGVGEENRVAMLNTLMVWAKLLPPHRKTVKKMLYTLSRTKKNGKTEILKTTTNYEEIRFEMSKEKNQKYTLTLSERMYEEW